MRGDTTIKLIICLYFTVYVSTFTVISPFNRGQIYHRKFNAEEMNVPTISQLHVNTDSNEKKQIDSCGLMIMDIVLYSNMGKNEELLQIGAIIDDGSIQPLTAWSLEEAVQFSGEEYIEFLVDHSNLNHQMTVNQQSSIFVHTVLDPITITYGSRQVGGGKGPGNPHGEESERLYYVKKSILEAKNVTIHINPALEIRW